MSNQKERIVSISRLARVIITESLRSASQIDTLLDPTFTNENRRSAMLNTMKAYFPKGKKSVEALLEIANLSVEVRTAAQRVALMNEQIANVLEETAGDPISFSPVLFPGSFREDYTHATTALHNSLSRYRAGTHLY